MALDPASGVLAIADQDLLTVTLIGPDGEWQIQWSRPGTGFGELGQPAALAWTDGGQLEILDSRNSKVLALDSGGRFSGERSIDLSLLGEVVGAQLFLQDSDVIAQPLPVPVNWDSNAESDMYVMRTMYQGRAVDTIARRRVEVSPIGAFSMEQRPIPGSSIPVVAPLNNDRLAVAGDIPEWRVLIVSRTGDVAGLICRTTKPVPLSDVERSRAETYGVSEQVSRRARIGRIFAGVDGRLWVQRNRASGADPMERWFGPPGATFDVFERTGTYLGEVLAPPDARLVASRGDTVIGLVVGWKQTASVAAYRLDAVR